MPSRPRRWPGHGSSGLGCSLSAQRVVNAAGAVQDAAIARLAAIEPEWLEDGTVVESPPGAGACGAGRAGDRVGGAVRLGGARAAAGADRGAPGRGRPGRSRATETGLGGLHAAMASGRLDAYRAGVVAEELEHAPAEVAATVVAALEGHFETEDGTHLRRRCRRVLTRISPDLLHQRAARARSECGLRRWADEPGVDRWEGTFPSEEAARAWAAIDALARQYVSDGVCSSIERARAKALTDLVAGNATIDTIITVTVPATAVPATAVPATAVPGTAAPGTAVPVAALAGEPGTRAVADAAVCARDDEPETPQTPATPVDTVIGGDALVEVTGPGAGEPVLVSHQWLTDSLETASAVQVASCHPVTGALLDDDPAAAAPDADPVARVVCCRGRVRRRLLPALHPDGETDPSPRPALPVPRLQHRRRLLRPRPRPTLAARPHPRRQPALPVPTPPPHQTTTRLAGHPRHRRRRDLDRPHRTDPHHPPRRRPPHHHPHRHRLAPAPVTGTTGTGTATAATATSNTSRARTVIPDGPHSELEFLLEHHGAAPPGPQPAEHQ